VTCLTNENDRELVLHHRLPAYLAAVSAAVGVGVESCTADFGNPASAYIALDTRLPRHPGRDVALLWDERHGWSAALENDSGQDLLVVAYLGGELVPRPQRLARFLAAVRRGDVPAVLGTPVLRDGEAVLLEGLRSYRPDEWRWPA
jgi:hypothetical protein